MIDDEENSTLSNTFENIKEEYYSKKSDRFEMIAAAVQLFLLQIGRLYQQQALHKRGVSYDGQKRDVEITAQFNDQLNQHFGQNGHKQVNRTVTYFAARLAVHPAYLNAAVKRHTGKSPQEHIMLNLLKSSKTLLLHSSMNIKEIAYHLAFNDPAHFSNFFKKYTLKNTQSVPGGTQ